MPFDLSPSSRVDVVFLGTGTSVGVPVLGCECHVCQSDDPLNNRTRCAILLRLDQGNLLVDTPPDLRVQLLREGVGLVHSVLFTHEHADHLFGLDDLRLFPFRLGHPVPLYCTTQVESRIRTSFDYAFSKRKKTHAGSVPQLEFRSIDTKPFEVLGVRVVPIPLKHGPNFDVLGFRIGDFAYCTDTNEIPRSSMKLLEGVRTFVVGALRFTPHPTHFNLDEAIAVAEQVNADQTYFTHLSHDLDYKTVMETLPSGMALAYDGLRTEARL